jgi:hypothetical protein
MKRLFLPHGKKVSLAWESNFENQFDFYTDELKKYLPKIKLVLKINLTFSPMN